MHYRECDYCCGSGGGDEYATQCGACHGTGRVPESDYEEDYGEDYEDDERSELADLADLIDEADAIEESESQGAGS